ncbi:hypothetical protein O3M35_004382 [Rhynocoris fuscipes]|uniref:6-pyruvoyltetrahydropterin synthase n=1 Tax=Rhynocoris fuscipes TaxID=488301 RepID=A0AAW1CH10_9HEMI
MAKTHPIAYLTRIAKISACHRLHSPDLSDEENAKIYGKCNNYHGHGHNYEIHVSVRGPVCPKTGMVMNITDLKLIIDETIMKSMDHKHLDKDVPYFFDKVSTTENVAIFIWNSIKEQLSKPELLYEIKIFETDNNVVVYRGE